MKKNGRMGPVVLIAIIIALGFAYLNRAAIKDAYERWTAPALPVPESYTPIIVSTSTPAEERPRQATSTTEQPTTSLPREKLLNVPFMSQAPHTNWDMPYQEACEEASVLMVRGYYQGTTGRYDPNEADKLILDLVRFQKEQYGYYEDTSATETKRFIEAAFPELEAEVVEMTGPESVMRYIAQGIPVILPADGKALPNPNFRNGGPRYHMLVVRGYTESRFITNDPGTRKGEKFLYTYDGLLDAVHDWNNGDVPHGRRVMVIIRPKGGRGEE
ncbi:MAG TPA: C39 family peptidase [Candidatus Methylomirabilis sp.]|nr:C39 family peptidase [Candidatus Methylomirabilis sp.]